MSAALRSSPREAYPQRPLRAIRLANGLIDQCAVVRNIVDGVAFRELSRQPWLDAADSKWF